MRLRLYSSIGSESPNLVSLQADDLEFLPTVLVCPVKQNVPTTIVRTEFMWQGSVYTALTELARPIRRQALRLVGTLDETISQDIMQKFLSILAR